MIGLRVSPALQGALDRKSTRDAERRPGPSENPVKLGGPLRQYERQLRSIGAHIGRLVRGFDPWNDIASAAVGELLARYADALAPWAASVGRAMLNQVDVRDIASWKLLSGSISQQLARDLRTAPVGQVMRTLLADQVSLIRSIPLDAAKRVHELTLKGLEDSSRYQEYVDEIRRSGEVAESHAILIARTETSRTATVLKQARAQSAGSVSFVWRTVGDADVRKDHRILNGHTFRWDDPPVADQRTGAKALPGAIFNCRCWAEPVLPHEQG